MIEDAEEVELAALLDEILAYNASSLPEETRNRIAGEILARMGKCYRHAPQAFRVLSAVMNDVETVGTVQRETSGKLRELMTRFAA